ncbi:alkaline phosphatase family protein [Gordonia sp. ABSL1-1]|uniref:alkaline phosphatase family protein n=1 Tax=Gordonia sp. ABSL1-1 TaxID=3053923 RepID=UPI002572DDA0|nr:alkaline phosphatase family protein [Gordonia sp. ABSL1-1]MDL9936004.1 alkaline phosphatase family protein [Gordonia sp. ABSL1-1]
MSVSIDLPPAAWSAYPHSLADVLPAIATAFGLDPSAGQTSTDVPALHIPERKDVVLLLVDGLGSVLLDEFASYAPTLASMRTQTLRAGFPATTATSLTSLTGGTACGVHGIIGYSFRPGDECRTRGSRRVLNALRWSLDSADGPSALVTYPPSLVSNTADEPSSGLEWLSHNGVRITYVMPGEFRGSGLTQVAFRAAGRYLPAVTPDGIRAAVGGVLARNSSHLRFVYAYFSELDMAGHIHGPGSSAWLEKLAVVDRLVADLAADLPVDACLLVTGDHGMIAAENSVDIDAAPTLRAGVADIAGEARVRHVYAQPHGADDVLAAWTAELDGSAHVVSREQAIDEGWFGTPVTSAVAERIGDVVAVARGATTLIRSEHEPVESRMVGHHGAWTAAELLVPLLDVAT